MKVDCETQFDALTHSHKFSALWRRARIELVCVLQPSIGNSEILWMEGKVKWVKMKEEKNTAKKEENSAIAAYCAQSIRRVFIKKFLFGKNRWQRKENFLFSYFHHIQSLDFQLNRSIEFHLEVKAKKFQRILCKIFQICGLQRVKFAKLCGGTWNWSDKSEESRKSSVEIR